MALVFVGQMVPNETGGLAFTMGPANTTAGATISPGVRVEVQDSSGNRVTTANESITIRIGTNPSGGPSRHGDRFKSGDMRKIAQGSCIKGARQVNMRRKGALFGLGLAVLSFVTLEKPSYAHTRWLVDKGEHAGEHYPKDLISLLVVLGAISFIGLVVAIDQAKWSSKIQRIGEKAYLLFPEGNEWRIIATLSGILLIVNSITGVFLATGLVLPSEGLVFPR